MGDDRAAVSIRLPRDVHQRLVAQADRRDVSVSFLAGKAIERALAKWEQQEIEA